MIKLANIKAPVKQTEESELLMLVKWVELVYPDAILKTNYDHFKASIFHAKRQKALKTSVKGYPDIFIAEIRKSPTGAIYGGLFIEFKKDNTKLLNKKLAPATPHLKQQSEMLNKLCNKGYYSCFGVGFEHTKEIIKKYMSWEQI